MCCPGAMVIVTTSGVSPVKRAYLKSEIYNFDGIKVSFGL